MLPVIEEDVAHLQNKAKDINNSALSKLLCRLLALRGIKDAEEAEKFFHPSLSDLHDPFLMKGMEKAVSRVQKAISQREKVMIFGDYDVDGTTAVSVVYSFLIKSFPQLSLCYYIPHRYKEGYGLSNAGIEKAADLGCGLIITLDCGITSIEEAALADQKGIDLIICDHHLPGQDLPNAIAILNPKQEGCEYPFKGLSGCGVGFKLISAIAKKEGLPEETIFQYLDLLAVSIVADIVPIDGENRVLATLGIKRANESPCIPLQKIKEVAKLSKDFSSTDMAFIVAPRINAVGRMDDARKVVCFFLENDPQKAAVLAEDLEQNNEKRRVEDKKITKEALSMLKNDKEAENHKSTVLFRPNWHKGVVGIVASRVLERYYRPTIILTESKGMITGSARSVRGFNIHDALVECASLLEKFGGHFFAAGLTMKPENFLAFKNRFEKVVSESIEEQSLTPEIRIDAELSFSQINQRFFNILRRFEPFGPSNWQPVFISKNVKDYNGNSRIVKMEHVRFVLKQNGIGQALTGIGFNLADKFPIVSSGKPFDVAYYLDENEWRGSKTIQLRVLDIRRSKSI